MKNLVYLILLIPSLAFADQVRTQVIIEDKVNGIDYRDAIYYDSLAEYELKVSEGLHNIERQARLDNFRDKLENPPLPYEPTKEDLEAEKAELEKKIAELDVLISKKDK